MSMEFEKPKKAKNPCERKLRRVVNQCRARRQLRRDEGDPEVEEQHVRGVHSESDQQGPHSESDQKGPKNRALSSIRLDLPSRPIHATMCRCSECLEIDTNLNT